MDLFGRRDEIRYLRAALAEERARARREIHELTLILVRLKREHFVEPRPEDDRPLPSLDGEVAPSIEVVIEEMAEQSHHPDQVRRTLARFAALKSTQGKSDAEIVTLIRQGDPGADDDEEDFV